MHERRGPPSEDTVTMLSNVLQQRRLTSILSAKCVRNLRCCMLIAKLTTLEFEGCQRHARSGLAGMRGPRGGDLGTWATVAVSQPVSPPFEHRRQRNVR